MGELDLREKSLFAMNDVFASFLNAFFVTRGEPPIKPEDLSDASPETVTVNRHQASHQIRDIIKCLRDDFGVSIALYGLENQTKPAKDMPIRIMAYDAMGYKVQAKHAKGKGKIIPIVTFVLYFGYDKRWDAPRALSECCSVPKRIKRWFVDYRIRIIELAWLTSKQIDKLDGDLKTIALCLRHFRNPKRWPFPNVKVQYVEEVLALLGKITGDKIFEKLLDEYQEHEEEDWEMASRLESYKEYYRSEGRTEGKKLGKKLGMELGEKRGIKKGKEVGKLEQLVAMTKRIMTKERKSLEDAMLYLQLDEGEKNSFEARWIDFANHR